MGKGKKLCSVLFVAGMLFGMTGCCITQEQANKAALKRFEERYGVDYEILYTEVIGDSREHRNEINIFVEDYMEEGEKARIKSWKEKGKAVSSDDFFGFVIRDDYEERVKKIAEEEYQNVKVYADFSYCIVRNDALTINSTLEDAYELGEKVFPDIDIVVVPDEGENAYQEKGERIANRLREENLQGSIEIYPVSEEDMEKIDRMNMFDCVDVWGENVYSGDSYID